MVKASQWPRMVAISFPSSVRFWPPADVGTHGWRGTNSTTIQPGFPGCARIMAPKKMPRPNPGNLGVCDLTSYKGLCRCDEGQHSEMGDDPRLHGILAIREPSPGVVRGAATAEAESERWNLAGCGGCGGAMSQGRGRPGAGEGQETDSCLDLPKEHTLR